MHTKNPTVNTGPYAFQTSIKILNEDTQFAGAFDAVCDSLRKHNYNVDVDAIENNEIELHEVGNYTTILMIDNVGTFYLGTAKRNPKDRKNRKIAVNIALYRCLEAYHKIGWANNSKRAEPRPADNLLYGEFCKVLEATN